MALSKVSGLFGVRDCKIVPITADAPGAAVTYGTALDVMGIKSLGTTLNVTSVENRGDEQVLDVEDNIDFIDVTWENAELPLDVLAAINGGEVTVAGTGTTETAAYVLSGTESQSKYFKIVAVPKRGSNDVKGIMLELYKVSGTLSFSFVGEGFATCSFTGKAIRTKGTVNSKANALYGIKFGAAELNIA